MTAQKEKRRGRLSAVVVRVIVLTMAAALLLTAYIQYNLCGQEQERMDYLSSTLSAETYEIMLSQFSKTQTLAAYLISTGGSYDGFDKIAALLLKEDYVRNVLFAPNGIVEKVCPLSGNESVLGLDMSGDGAGNLEAQAAIAKGELYMAGPFALIQGGLGIAGRLPVYLRDGLGRPYFWGIVSVTLDYPAALASSSMKKLEGQGFRGRLWRVNPDDGAEQTILQTDTLPRRALEKDYPISLFNSTWTISLAPAAPWYGRLSFFLCLACSLLASLLAGFAAYNVEKVRQLRQEETQRQISDLRRKLEREQTNMLLRQISSHFFYHTLNALQALIVLQPDSAYKMAGDFSRYLRINVDSITAANGLGSFREEMRAVRAYADINILQLGDRLNVVYEIPDEDFTIPVLTIQPIVENAVLHGIKPKVGGGTVTITLTDTETCHVVTVADDGLGFEPEEAAQSVGLANVRRRIAQFPGCSISVDSSPGNGTRVTLCYEKYLQIPE